MISAKTLPKHLLRSSFPALLRNLATASVPVENVEETRRSSRIQSRVVQKQPTREPFVKNLFLGNVDITLLPYPEVLTNEHLSELEQRLTPIANYFDSLETKNKIEPSVWGDLKALSVMDEFDTETERARMQEIISNGSISTILNSNKNLGVKALVLYGTEQQKAKYLKNGDLKVGFCLLEDVRGSLGLFSTEAKLDEDQIWNLNGEKQWVVNGQNADIFLVFCQTQILNYKNEPEPASTVFIVDPKMPGVSVTLPNPVGIEEANLCSVNFSNVKLMSHNLLGEVGNGINIATTLLKSNRLQVGAEASGVLRRCLKNVIEHIITRSQTECKLTDMDFVKKLIGQMSVKLYAIESLTYLTTGLTDGYENQDVDLESTIVKVFSSENCLSALEDGCHLLGPESYNKNHPINSMINNTRRHLLFDESNILLKHYIALLGLQHAGVGLSEIVRRNRNPLFNPGFIFKKMWTDRNQARDQPSLTLNMDYYYHPSLRNYAQMAEYCILRLKYVTEVLLSRYGPEIVTKQLELERLSNIACDVYTMIAVLGRSSRSYCIGLQNSEHEVLAASTFCVDAMQRVKTTANEIITGSYSTNDENYLHLGNKTFQWKNYLAEHPTKRNF